MRKSKIWHTVLVKFDALWLPTIEIKTSIKHINLKTCKTFKQ